MCTEKENEELMEVLITAARAAFLSLKETTKEHFYFYVFIFDEGMHPYISAWSYEALEASKLSDDELYETEWEVRIELMEEAMKRLDASGLFGTGKERECVVINVEQAPPDGDGAEYDRALRLNPPSALVSEYLEACETPENDQPVTANSKEVVSDGEWLSLCYGSENTETYFSYNPEYANTVERLEEVDLGDENVYTPINYDGQSPIPKCQAITDMYASVKAVEYFIRTGELYPGIDWAYYF